MNKIKRNLSTIRELIEVAKKEKICLKIMITGRDGNGFDLIVVGNDFANFIVEGFKFYEIQDVVEEFANYLIENGIKFEKNIKIGGSDILANIHHDEDCKRIIKELSKKERQQVEKDLLKYRRNSI